MNFPSDTTAYYVTGILLVLTAVTAVLLKWRFSFWKRIGIPCLTSPVKGIRELLLREKSIGEYIAGIYKEAKSQHLGHVGGFFFIKPTYIPLDTEIIKHILTKDFGNFMNRGVYFDEEHDPLSGHLFSIEDEMWRSLRHKLSPTFTSGQMKSMFPTLVACGEKLREHMKQYSNSEAIDIKDVLARFTTDIIGSCAFGIECNSLENPNAEFRKYGKMVFDCDLIEHLRRLAHFSLPRKFLRFFHLAVFKKEATKFFMDAVKNTVDYREANNIDRKDFMHLLIQLKNHGGLYENGKHEGGGFITMNELAAQAFVFYLAGFETSSTAVTFALYELALQQDIQDKLRDEVQTVLAKHGGKLTYEGVMEMHFMQQVLEGIYYKNEVITNKI